MEVLRLGVSVSPKPVLSVEFVRDRQLFVWRVEFQVPTGSVDELALEMKKRFPKYLGKISIGQLARLIRFGCTMTKQPKPSLHHDLNKLNDSELEKAKTEMSVEFERNLLQKTDKNYSYDFQIDFPSPRGPPFD